MRTGPAPAEIPRRARRALSHLLAVVVGALLAVAVVAALGRGDARDGAVDSSSPSPSPSPFTSPSAPSAPAAAVPPTPAPTPTAAPSPSPSPSPTPVVADRSVLEAEDGDLDGPMRRAAADGASGGAFVGVEDGEGDGDGSVTFAFEVPSAGSYVVWARVLAPDEGSNSFFVQVDDGEELTWHAPGPARSQTAQGWTWAAVRQEDAATPQLFLLEPGRHALRFGAREDGTGLDRVLVTSDLAEEPGG